MPRSRPQRIAPQKSRPPTHHTRPKSRPPPKKPLVRPTPKRTPNPKPKPKVKPCAIATKECSRQITTEQTIGFEDTGRECSRPERRICRCQMFSREDSAVDHKVAMPTVTVNRMDTTNTKPDDCEAAAASNQLDVTTKASSSVTFICDLPETDPWKTAPFQAVSCGDVTDVTSTTSASLTDRSQHSRVDAVKYEPKGFVRVVVTHKKPRRRFKIRMKRFKKRKKTD